MWSKMMVDEKKADDKVKTFIVPQIPYANDYETFGEKFSRKTRENPFVPIGLLVTIGALSAGLYSLKIGDTKLSQKMMRMRVFAQGFTVFAVMGGVFYHAGKKN